MADDKYRRLEETVSGDLHKASIAAHVGLEDRYHRVRIRGSQLPSLIPNGSEIEIEPIVYHKLKFGAIVYVKVGRELELRRFLRLEIARDVEFLVLWKEGARQLERVPVNSLVGRVSMARSKDRTLRMPRSGNLIEQLTDFGTTTPLAKLRWLLVHWKGVPEDATAKRAAPKKTAR